MHSLDEQINRIVNYVNNSEEPTLLVFFSDHLPNLSAVTDESTYDVDLYQTPYLIYSNAPLNPVLPYENMTSYQLGAYALNLLGTINVQNYFQLISSYKIPMQKEKTLTQILV